MTGNLRIIAVAGVLIPVTFVLLPVQFVAVQLGWRISRSIPVLWHRLVARLIGLRVRVSGSLEADRPLMIIANHISWMDIVALSTIAPVCFIAKSEVARIPFAGLLARLQRSVFIVREERRNSANQAREIASRLMAGDIMVLFAEGTTGMGDQILPFKSSLLGAAQFAVSQAKAQKVKIQPVTIAYTHTHGVLNARRQRVRASWPGTIELLPHAGQMIRQGAIDVEVSFAPAMNFESGDKRRIIANQAQAAVTKMYQEAIFPRHR